MSTPSSCTSAAGSPPSASTSTGASSSWASSQPITSPIDPPAIAAACSNGASSLAASWPQNSATECPAELVECQRHESLLNLAFADTAGFRLLCPYDTSALGEDVLAEARRSHPVLRSNGAVRESVEYRGLDEASAPFAEPLPEAATQPQSWVFKAGTLPALRQLVARRARIAGFGTEMAEDLVSAVNEVATNSVVYGGGGGILRVWSEGDALVCEVGDRGFIDDPLVGRERPLVNETASCGLWLANQLCDLVQVRSFAGGSVVRLHKRRRA